MEKIKLVIWDLDDTFWKGTLSEGGIEIIEENVTIIKELSSRGILNSIASKNSFDKVKEVLSQLGIWDYFIFPQIAWSPKGELVKSIIQKAQFRPCNVLFIDDNNINIEEVKFYNKDIQVATPDFIKLMLDNPFFKGKPDKELSRLKDYKLLEEKDVLKQGFSSNDEFLQQSEIAISIISDLNKEVDRVFELIERTNQLNYTKNRLTLDETRDLIFYSDNTNFCVHAKDKYGDYGIIGFVSYDSKHHYLDHFIFSCRILNLGIEQYIFSKLGFPNIKIKGEVITSLSNETPNWISEYNIDDKKISNGGNEIKVFFKGGCDLDSMLHYLSDYNVDLVSETNYVLSNNFPTHVEHTDFLINSVVLKQEQKEYFSNSLPFIDDNAFNTKLFECKYDILVFSVLMDYTQQLYRHKATNIRIPFGGYNNHLTDEENIDEIVLSYNKKGINSITSKFLKSFSEEYSREGQISPSEFYKNLEKIRALVKEDIPIIFINGAEVDFHNEKEIGSVDRHKEMNKVLDKFVHNHKANCFLLDVRKIVLSTDDIDNNLRHYTRPAYYKLSKELIKTIQYISGKSYAVDPYKKYRRIRQKIASYIKKNLSA
jgi:FkbH-like protein